MPLPIPARSIAEYTEPYTATVGASLATPRRAETSAERAWSILEQAVRDSKEERRANAVHALGLLVKNRRAGTLAEGALADPKPEVRAAGATALGQIGLRASIPKLQAAPKDGKPEVVFAAAGALHALQDPTAYRVYYAALTGQRKTGEPILESELETLKDPKVLAEIGLEQGIGLIPFAGVGYDVFRTSARIGPVPADRGSEACRSRSSERQGASRRSFGREMAGSRFGRQRHR